MVTFMPLETAESIYSESELLHTVSRIESPTPKHRGIQLENNIGEEKWIKKY